MICQLGNLPGHLIKPEAGQQERMAGIVIHSEHISFAGRMIAGYHQP